MLSGRNLIFWRFGSRFTILSFLLSSNNGVGILFILENKCFSNSCCRFWGFAKCIIINWEIDIHVTLLTLYICNQRYMNKIKWRKGSREEVSCAEQCFDHVITAIVYNHSPITLTSTKLWSKFLYFHMLDRHQYFHYYSCVWEFPVPVLLLLWLSE